MLEAALRDELTEAYNREFFDDHIETEFSFARRHETELVVLVLDVDEFEDIEQEHGDSAADYTLKHLVDTLQKSIRKEDILARYEDHQFVIACREISVTQGATLAERLRKIVSNEHFTPGDEPLDVTVSIGVSGYPDTSVRKAEQLLASAEEAMEAARDSGQNCVMVKSN